MSGIRISVSRISLHILHLLIHFIIRVLNILWRIYVWSWALHICILFQYLILCHYIFLNLLRLVSIVARILRILSFLCFLRRSWSENLGWIFPNDDVFLFSIRILPGVICPIHIFYCSLKTTLSRHALRGLVLCSLRTKLCIWIIELLLR